MNAAPLSIVRFMASEQVQKEQGAFQSGLNAGSLIAQGNVSGAPFH